MSSSSPKNMQKISKENRDESATIISLQVLALKEPIEESTKVKKDEGKYKND